MRNAAQKSKYTGKIKQNAPTIPAIVPIETTENLATVLVAPETQDQTAIALESESGDQKKHRTKAKKHSTQVVLWKEQQKFPVDWIVTNIGENKKRGKAKARFDLYREGMTVAAYQDAFIEKKVGTRALASADLRWDHVAGFIKVVPPKVDLPAEEPHVPAEEA